MQAVPTRTATDDTRSATFERLADEATKLAVPVGPARATTVAPRPAVRRARFPLRASLVALGLFGGLFALVKADRSAALDVAITMRLQRRRHPLIAGLMRAVSWPGFPPQSRLIPPIIVASLWGLGLRLEAMFQVVAWGGALLSTAIKGVTRRPRPAGEGIDVVIAPLGGSSFPSGHVLTYVGLYGFLATIVHSVVRPRALRRTIVGGLTALLALVGPSRIIQGHHWPTDVLASYLLGLPFLAAVVTLYRRVKAGALESPRQMDPLAAVEHDPEAPAA
jgi:membrane-associated phospholipid phosphatase